MRRVLLVLAFLLALVHPASAGFMELLDAARANDTALARKLLAEGSEPNGGPSGYSDSYTPLQWAAYHGNAELVALLLAAGADTERRDFNGDRAILWAARAGRPAIVRDLIEAGSPVDSAADPYRQGPLLLAARGASPETVRVLVAAGALIDARDHSGSTALHEAALSQSFETVWVLLDAGADPSIADDILRETPLHIAAARQEASIVRTLLAAGAAPIGWNSDGGDPLHIAAARGLPDNVKALLAAGADPLALDAHGRTPMQAAIVGKRHEVWNNDTAAEHLVLFVADLDATFLAAAAADMPWTARSLLARGADPNAVSAAGVPALAYVTRIGDIPGTALLEAMIKMGVDLSRFGIDGLLAAAGANNTDAAARLLEFGIPIDGDATRSPLLEAAEAGAVDMVEFLLARGAVPVDPARVTLAELTPIDLLAFDQGQQSAALDTAGIAIRERLGALRARQRAAIALLEAARSR